MASASVSRRQARSGSGGTDGNPQREALHLALLAELPGLQHRARTLERIPAAADDLVQDTVERALRHAGRFEPGSSLRHWLYRIMLNVFIDRCRSRVRFTGLDESVTEARTEESETPPLWIDLAMEDVTDAANTLEEPLRTTFQLGCVDRLSYRTVAERLCIPVTTVGTRLLRARAKVRLRLLERLPTHWALADRNQRAS